MKTLKELGFKRDAYTYKTYFSKGVNEITIHNDKTCIIELEKPTKEMFDAILLEVGFIEKRKKLKLTENDEMVIGLILPFYKWIARDSDNKLCCFEEKPSKGVNEWLDEGGECSCLRALNGVLSSITWKDAEPTSLDELRALL